MPVESAEHEEVGADQDSQHQHQGATPTHHELQPVQSQHAPGLTASKTGLFVSSVLCVCACVYSCARRHIRNLLFPACPSLTTSKMHGALCAIPFVSRCVCVCVCECQCQCASVFACVNVCASVCVRVL